MTPDIARFGRVLCVEALEDIPQNSELFVKYDVAVDSTNLKSVLKTALNLGHIFSGKSKQQFSKDVKPYLKVFSDLVKTVDMKDLIKFS